MCTQGTRQGYNVRVYMNISKQNYQHFCIRTESSASLIKKFSNGHDLFLRGVINKLLPDYIFADSH
jgi:hypothetical protein